MGLLTRNDSTIFRNFFKEMALLRGISVMYQYPIDMKFSMYGEENPLGFSEYVPINIIFEENPKINTLRKYGWISENPDDKPYIAHLSYDITNLCKGCRITIPPPAPLNADNTETNIGRTFVITDITSNLEYPDTWVCKLAPVMHNKPIKQPDYTDTNTNFIKKEYL